MERTKQQKALLPVSGSLTSEHVYLAEADRDKDFEKPTVALLRLEEKETGEMARIRDRADNLTIVSLQISKKLKQNEDDILKTPD